jgi:hypothetical protein
MPKKQLFKPEQFTATQWDTVEDKVKFCEQFVKFVESDFSREQFPKWFYIRLSLIFGHIAHYNQEGFYGTYFTTTNNKAYFIQQTMEYRSYGDPTWTYCDAEQAIQQWLRDHAEIMVNLIEKNMSEKEARERAQLAKLKEKYGE